MNFFSFFPSFPFPFFFFLNENALGVKTTRRNNFNFVSVVLPVIAFHHRCQCGYSAKGK